MMDYKQRDEPSVSNIVSIHVIVYKSQFRYILQELCRSQSLVEVRNGVGWDSI